MYSELVFAMMGGLVSSLFQNGRGEMIVLVWC